MAECNNCESFVSSDYSRVFSTNSDGSVDVCPNCEDIMRGKDARPRKQRY